ILHPDSLQNIIKSGPNIIESTVTKLVEFIDTHQFVLLILILIYESSRIVPLGLGYIEYVGNLLRSDLYVSGLLCNGNDFVPGVDIMSRFPVSTSIMERKPIREGLLG
nr:hypothetical protein [Tanacetum cinerariifolium]